MRKIAMIIGCFISLTYVCFAQDVIVTKSGTKINAKVLEIRDGSIWFKLYDNQNGPTYSIQSDTVSEVIYQQAREEPASPERTTAQPASPAQRQRQVAITSPEQQQRPVRTVQQDEQNQQKQTNNNNEVYETYEQYKLAQERIKANTSPFSWGVKAGLNVSSIFGYKGITDYYEADKIDAFSVSYKAGFNAGLNVQYMFTPQIGIESGLLFSNLGTKYKYKQDNRAYNSNYDVNGSIQTYYLQIPVSFLYKFEIMEDLYIYPSAGLYAGYGINGIEKEKGMNTDFDNNSYLYDTNLFGRAVRRTTITNGGKISKSEQYVDKIYKLSHEIEMANRFDLGWTVGATLQYTKFTFGLGYEQGLIAFDKDWVLWDKTDYKGFYDLRILKNSNFKVSVGYFF